MGYAPRYSPGEMTLQRSYCQRATTSRPSSSSRGKGMNALPESTQTGGDLRQQVRGVADGELHPEGNGACPCAPGPLFVEFHASDIVGKVQDP